MREPKITRKDCEYYNNCWHVAAIDLLAHVGGRTLGSVPNCATCSCYNPPSDEKGVIESEKGVEEETGNDAM